MSGGLIAFSLDDADRVLDWAATLKSEGVPFDKDDEVLRDRLTEWRARHVEVGSLRGD